MDQLDNSGKSSKVKRVELSQSAAIIIAAVIGLIGAGLFKGGTVIYNNLNSNSGSTTTTSVRPAVTTLPNHSTSSSTPANQIPLNGQMTDEADPPTCGLVGGRTFQRVLVVDLPGIDCGGIPTLGGAPWKLHFRLTLAGSFQKVTFSAGTCDQAVDGTPFAVTVAPSVGSPITINLDPAHPVMNRSIVVSGAQTLEFSAVVPSGSCFVLDDPEGI